MARVADALRAVTDTAAHPVTPAAAVGRTQRFAVVARSATGRTAPQ